MGKEEVTGDSAVIAEGEHLAAVLRRVSRILQIKGDDLGIFGRDIGGPNLMDAREALREFVSKHPKADTEETRYYLTDWIIRAIAVSQVRTLQDTPEAAAILKRKIEASLYLQSTRVHDVQKIEDHFKLEDNDEAELMAIRVAAFFVDALKQGQKIILRGKDGKESEVAFECVSDADDQESPAHD